MLKTVFVEELDHYLVRWGELRHYKEIGWTMVVRTTPIVVIPIDASYKGKGNDFTLSGETLELVAFVPSSKVEKDNYFRFVSELIRGIVDD